MQKKTFGQRFFVLLKLVGIGAIALVLAIPLGMVRNLISERAGAKDEVVRDIARTAADAQRLVLPVMVVPYTRKWVEATETIDEKLNKKVVRVERSESGNLQFLPEQVALSTRPVLDSSKHRGLYQVLTYSAALDVKGRFAIPKDFGYVPAEGKVSWGVPVFAFGVSDPRGIKNSPLLKWGGAELPFAPGTAGDLTHLGNGISAALGGLQAGAAQDIDFSFTVEMDGMERVSFVPTGRETRVSLAADWPHPSFFGKFSPKSEVKAGKFSADWQTSFFSTNAKQAYASCVGTAKCDEFMANEFGVSFIQPANLYQQLERSTKYGFLFIGLTFAAFFLFEILKSLAVHPLQYGLVGLALAMFFVLLVSLSEHLGFAVAYAIASTACVGLLVVYLAAVLGTWQRALGIGSLLAGLYGVLFMLLKSEDYALLMGSLFLFALLAAVMVGTRRVNWYAAGPAAADAAAAPAPEGGLPA